MKIVMTLKNKQKKQQKNAYLFKTENFIRELV